MYRVRLVLLGTLTSVVFARAALAASTEPKMSFGAAHGLLLESETAGASAAILKAVKFIKKEAATAAADAKKGLTTAAAELEKVASEVAKGSVTSANKLAAPFARTHAALAKHYLAKAKAAWAKKDGKGTGSALTSAVGEVECAAKWASYKLDATAKAGVSKAKEVGKKLEQGQTVPAADVTKALGAVGAEADKLAKKAAVMK